VIRKIAMVMIIGVFFTGCSVVQPITPTIEDDNNKSMENNQTLLPSISEKEQIEEIESVFSHEFEEETNRESLIESLDAFPWEKEALQKVYSSHDEIWSSSQKEAFKQILEDDSYLSICADRRYLDNLEFIEEGFREDILYSILLLKYLNNLKSGCLEWVSSDTHVKNENSVEAVRSDYILSMLPKGVLIQKLILFYSPKNREFLDAVKHYKALEMGSASYDELKTERLNIEQYKTLKEEPDYNE